MGVLANLEPKNVFKYFETICSIPHGSGNTGAMADYCVKFAEDRGFEWYRDATNNVIIRKKGSKGYESADTIILQGHLDMVCEKDEGVDFDFEMDAIPVVVDGDWLRTRGTTLGGDNGIAIAMVLALLDDDSLAHPPIEALFTSDEESGLIGAFALDCSKLTGHKLLNLDSEYEGVLMCSCAGGVNAYSTLPVERETVKAQLVELEISGLMSGHSGVEIDKGRANSNVLMARLMAAIGKVVEYNLVSLDGGSRETAIAAATKAVIAVKAGSLAAVLDIVTEYAEIFGKEYTSPEPNMVVKATVGEACEASALTAADTKKVYTVLVALPDSVQAMSMDMPGLVQTSTNFGVLKLKDDELYFANTIRSSMTTQKKWIFDKVAAIVTLAGGKTVESGNYPGWAYNPDSVLKDTILAAYEKLTGKKATVEAVHAGIECGLFADSIKDLDCVSIGPTMADVHTPKEHLSISSTARTYELLKMILSESK